MLWIVQDGANTVVSSADSAEEAAEKVFDGDRHSFSEPEPGSEPWVYRVYGPYTREYLMDECDDDVGDGSILPGWSDPDNGPFEFEFTWEP